MVESILHESTERLAILLVTQPFQVKKVTSFLSIKKFTDLILKQTLSKCNNFCLRKSREKQLPSYKLFGKKKVVFVGKTFVL
jgi:hypothetical protein